MNDRLKKHLLDAADAVQAVLDFLGDADAAQHAANRLLRSAVVNGGQEALFSGCKRTVLVFVL